MPSYLGMKEKKDNKRRAEDFLKQEMDKPEKIQDHHLTGTNQPLPALYGAVAERGGEVFHPRYDLGAI